LKDIILINNNKILKMNNNNEKLVGFKLYMIMVGMLIAGTLNTLLTKW